MKNKKGLPQLQTVSLREVLNLQTPSESGRGSFYLSSERYKSNYQSLKCR